MALRGIDIDAKAFDDGYRWFTKDQRTGDVLVWNHQPFPSRPAALRDAEDFHTEMWRGRVPFTAYDGAFL